MLRNFYFKLICCRFVLYVFNGKQKILLGQITTQLSLCSIHQIGANLDTLSPSKCSNTTIQKERQTATKKGIKIMTIILTCK